MVTRNAEGKGSASGAEEFLGWKSLCEAGDIRRERGVLSFDRWWWWWCSSVLSACLFIILWELSTEHFPLVLYGFRTPSIVMEQLRLSAEHYCSPEHLSSNLNIHLFSINCIINIYNSKYWGPTIFVGSKTLQQCHMSAALLSIYCHYDPLALSIMRYLTVNLGRALSVFSVHYPS